MLGDLLPVFRLVSFHGSHENLMHCKLSTEALKQ